MAQSINPFIVDGNRGNFQDVVLDNSRKGPVLVNYWTEKAGPCLRLWPLLEKLATEYAGRFLLVNLNTDDEGALAREYGVNSVPTVKLFLQGRVVDTIHGAESEAQFRRLIDRHLARESDAQLARAVDLYRQGKVDQAFASLDSLMIHDPENLRIFIAYAKLLMREQDYKRVIEVLDFGDQQQRSEEAATLQANAHLLDIAAQAPPLAQLQRMCAENADDAELLIQLAARQLIDDDYAAALGSLLRILHLDRHYRNGIAAQSMRAIFNMLGRDEPLVKDFRRRMMDLN